ncbi:MAG: hypothetical protein KBD37_00325 [Burkholderiales bacterium]|nr:hypothetical protein [Burkholderiales bacterium]
MHTTRRTSSQTHSTHSRLTRAPRQSPSLLFGAATTLPPPEESIPSLHASEEKVRKSPIPSLEIKKELPNKINFFIDEVNKLKCMLANYNSLQEVQDQLKRPLDISNTTVKQLVTRIIESINLFVPENENMRPFKIDEEYIIWVKLDTNKIELTINEIPLDDNQQNASNPGIVYTLWGVPSTNITAKSNITCKDEKNALSEERIHREHPYLTAERKLFEQREKLKEHHLNYFLSRDLCPAHISLRHTPQYKPEITHCETYFRSELNPFTKHITKNKLIEYDENNDKVQKVRKEHGWHAHIGNYKNYMHVLEKELFQPLPSKISTSKGNGKLYNSFIKYKNRICNHIAVNTGDTTYIKVGHYFEYGCLMVYISDQSCFGKSNHLEENKFKSWVNIIISYFTALVNFHCYQKGLAIELERRGGFGFVTPSIAETGCSFRISVGIIPLECANIIINCLKILEDSLQNIQQSLPFDVTTTFYSSPEHLKYLEKQLYRVGLYENKKLQLYNILYKKEKNELYYKKSLQQGKVDIVKITDTSQLLAKRKNSKQEIKNLKKSQTPIEATINELHQTKCNYLNNILPGCISSIDNNKVRIDNNIANGFDFLWTPIEKDGAILLESLTRTSYSRIIISQELFKEFSRNGCLKGSTNRQFFTTIEQLTQKIHIDNGHLTLQQTTPITSDVEIKSEPFKINDNIFWEVVKQTMISLENSSIVKDVQSVIDCLNSYYNSRTIDDKFYATFEALNELIFIAAINHSTNDGEAYGDGYGSDSDEELDITPATSNKIEKLSAKKLITHNGMRAIILAITAINTTDDRVWIDKAYYEVPLGIKIINALQELNIAIKKDRIEANILLMDANPCITDPHSVELVNEPFLANDGAKKLIIDITSSSIEQCNKYVNQFIESRSSIMVFVDSGAKHQQFSTKNQYGAIRIFAKNKNDLDALYKKIKSFNEPILSKTSHKLRRIMKELGMTFTNNAIIHMQSPSPFKDNLKSGDNPTIV